MVPEIKVVQFTAETEVSTRISNKLHSALETFKDVVYEMLQYCHEHNKQLDTYEAHRYRRMLKGRVSKNHDTFLATARQRTIKMLEHELHDECVEKLNGWYVKKGGWKFVEKEGRLYVKLSLPRGHLVMPYDIPWKLVECAKINPVAPASVYLNLNNCDKPRVEVLYRTEEDLEWATTNYAVYNAREQELNNFPWRVSAIEQESELLIDPKSLTMPLTRIERENKEVRIPQGDSKPKRE